MNERFERKQVAANVYSFNSPLLNVAINVNGTDKKINKKNIKQPLR